MKVISSQEKGVHFSISQVPWKALVNEAGPPLSTHRRRHTCVAVFTRIRSFKIPLGVRFIGVVIGFITPLHHSAALPFAMVDEPLRPLKHGRLRDWGWGKGGKEGGWRKARCLRSLLLHLLHQLLMLSIHLFRHCWRSLYMVPHSPLRSAPSATSPLSLSTKKVSEWTAILYSAASKEAEKGRKFNFLGPATGGGDVTRWREEAAHWPSEVSVLRAAADGQATRWIWMRAVKRVMRQGRPPPSNQCRLEQCVPSFTENTESLH